MVHGSSPTVRVLQLVDQLIKLLRVVKTVDHGEFVGP